MKNEMEKQTLVAISLISIAIIVILFLNDGCTLSEQKKWANSALDAEQFACVIAMELTDEAAVASICHISDELRPILHSILSAKAAAKKASAPHIVDGGPDGTP